MLLRPKPGDTEEDILLMQEQFMKSGNLPSASLSKTGLNKKGGLLAPQSRVDCTGRVILCIIFVTWGITSIITIRLPIFQNTL